MQAFFVDNVYLYKAPATDPTGVENNMLDNRSMKVIENGKLIIRKNISLIAIAVLVLFYGISWVTTIAVAVIGALMFSKSEKTFMDTV